MDGPLSIDMDGSPSDRAAEEHESEVDSSSSSGQAQRSVGPRSAASASSAQSLLDPIDAETIRQKELCAAIHHRSRVLREARMLEQVVRSTKMLVAALQSGDPAVIERACGAAEEAGVNAGTVSAARERVRQLRETSLLRFAVRHSTSPEEIEQECNAAAACGVDEGIVAAVRARVRQLREERLLSAVLRSTDAEEIDRACQEATAAGVSEGTINAARGRARQLRQAQLLEAATQGLESIQQAHHALFRRIFDTLGRPQSNVTDHPTTADADTLAAAARAAVTVAAVSNAWTNTECKRLILEGRDRAYKGGSLRTSAALAAAASEARDRCCCDAESAAAVASAAEAASNLESCTICLESLGSVSLPLGPASAGSGSEQTCSDPQPEEVCMLPCYHAFHCGCVKSWLRSRGTCPNCRLRPQLEASRCEASAEGTYSLSWMHG